MFIGGMAGSTTCSIKTPRWLVVRRRFDATCSSHDPRAVRPIRPNGSVVDEETIRDSYAYTLVSLLFFVLATVFASP